jgi:hypothetical protein
VYLLHHPASLTFIITISTTLSSFPTAVLTSLFSHLVQQHLLFVAKGNSGVAFSSLDDQTHPQNAPTPNSFWTENGGITWGQDTKICYSFAYLGRGGDILPVDTGSNT